MRQAIVFFIAFLLTTNCLVAKTININLSEAIEKKMVTTEGVNINGNYMGKTMSLSVTNISKETLVIKVDNGVVFKPEDPINQPMVIAGEPTLVIQPTKKNSVDVYTFCGNAPRHCPAKEHKYTYGYKASDTLIKVLQFIKTNSLYDDLGQSAVWAITNHNSLSDIYDTQREAIANELLALVMRLTNREKPQYHTVSKHDAIPDAPAYVPKTLKIIADFELRLEAPKVLTLGVFDASGKMIQSVFENQEFGALGHRFEVEFESADVQSGNYYIRLKEGEKIIKEQVVKVE